MSQKYVVAHFFDDLDNGYNFSAKAWPLHITLLPLFVLNGSITELENKLGIHCAQLHPVKTSVIGHEMFGPDRNIPVSLMDPTPEVTALHNKLVDIIKGDVIFDHPQFIGLGFRPHVSDTPAGRLNENEVQSIDSLTLVDMYPQEDIDRREILRTYRFKLM